MSSRTQALDGLVERVTLPNGMAANLCLLTNAQADLLSEDDDSVGRLFDSLLASGGRSRGGSKTATDSGNKDTGSQPRVVFNLLQSYGLDSFFHGRPPPDHEKHPGEWSEWELGSHVSGSWAVTLIGWSASLSVGH